MAENIATSLKNSGQLQNYRLGVKYQDGTAWLLGNVTDSQQEQSAIQLAEQMPGVHRVVSKLDIADRNGADRDQAVSDESPSVNSPSVNSPSVNYAQSLQLASAEMKQPQRSVPNQQLRRTQQSRSNQMPMPAQRIATAPMNPQMQMQMQMQMQRQQQMQMMQQMPPRPQAMDGMGPQQAQMQYIGNNGGARPANYAAMGPGGGGGGMNPMPAGYTPGGTQAVSYDQGQMPGYAWPSYAASPNYAALTYPRQYSPSAWPYIGPFYPYPQVPLGWRKVSLEWDDGWWFLDFNDTATH
jgi:hypothetical protein